MAAYDKYHAGPYFVVTEINATTHARDSFLFYTAEEAIAHFVTACAGDVQVQNARTLAGLFYAHQKYGDDNITVQIEEIYLK